MGSPLRPRRRRPGRADHDPERLALLSRWQRQIAHQPGIRAVIGPVGRRPRHQAAAQARGDARRRRPRRSRRPRPSRARACATPPGRSPSCAGASPAGAAGSALLGAGAGRAQRGAGLLAEGLEQAATGGGRPRRRIGRLAEGSKKLADAQRKTAVGSLTLQLGLNSLVPRLRGGSLKRARELATALATAAGENPALLPQARQARTLARAIASARDEVKRLRGIARQGQQRPQSHLRRRQEPRTGSRAPPERLPGADRRALEPRRRRRPSRRRARRASRAGSARCRRAWPKASGSHARSKSACAAPGSASRPSPRRSPRAPGASIAARRGSSTPATSSSRPWKERRAAAPGARRRGGQPPRRRPGSADADHLRLRPQQRRVAPGRRPSSPTTPTASGARAGCRPGLAGGAATINDYGSVTRARIPLVVGAVVIACFLMLLLILRAPLLAALAVVLNLASVAAAIGVMALVCRIPDGYPLGGHPYVDTVGAAAIFGVTFGLSIDYAVFLLARMRENYRRARRQPRGDPLRAREDRRGDHRRGRDHGRCLHLLRDRADRDGQPDGGRADRRDPARRDDRADRPAAGADAPARRSGLENPGAGSTACCQNWSLRRGLSGTITYHGFPLEPLKFGLR